MIFEQILENISRSVSTPYFQVIYTSALILLGLRLIFLIFKPNVAEIIPEKLKAYIRFLPVVRNKYLDKLFSIQRFVVLPILLLVVFGCWVFIFGFKPNVTFPGPIFDPVVVSMDKPLTVKFDRPINSKLISAQITPSIGGRWITKSSFPNPFFKNKLLFYPNYSLAQDSDYIVDISNIASVFGTSQKDEHLFVFKTSPLPIVINSDPANNAENVAIESPVIFKLDRNDLTVDWSIEISPEVEFDQNIKDFEIKITPKQILKQGQKYSLKVKRKSFLYDYINSQKKDQLSEDRIYELSFTTVSSAVVSSVDPSGDSVLPNALIKIEFAEEMDKSAVLQSFKIDPAISMNFSWDGDKILTLAHAQDFAKDTKYTITLNKSARTAKGGSFEEDYKNEFKTVGAVKTKSTNPPENAGNVNTSSRVSIQFDQPVDHSLAQTSFSISPATEGNFEWENDTMHFIPVKPLSFETNYTANLKPGIRSVLGFDSNQEFNLKFSTAPKIFTLPLTNFKQHYSFTCFSIAAKIALDYRGVKGISEIGFFDEIGYDQTPRNFTTNIWGDPNRGVVGTYNGSGPGGYGTHWEPVAKAISKYRAVDIKQGWNIPDLLREVEKGNPVIVWWVNGVWPTKDVSWNTPDGRRIYTVNGMHTEVVKGFVGDLKNPEKIITADPWRGERHYSKESFLALWKWFNNTAVIVN